MTDLTGNFRSKKYLKNILLSLVLILATAGLTYAAFGDRGKVLGSKFSVGSADIKLLLDNSAGIVPENLMEGLPGPEFNGIAPNWSEDYNLKIFNSGTSAVILTTNADYLTANDPDDLRSVIFVEPFIWNDTNNNGVVDTGETGDSLGRKSIIKWKTEGYQIGELNSGEILGLILRFSTDALSETKQGTNGVFDFVFDSIGL
jgi:hypothetical protein